MTTKEAIVFEMRTTRFLAEAFTQDLSRDELHHRVVPGANAAAWIMGHLVMAERRSLLMLGVPEAELPKLPAGFEQAFARDESAPKASDFGDAAAETPGLFLAHRDALIAAVEKADDAKFEEELAQPIRDARTVGQVLLFFQIHVATHLGQISTIRRSVGKPPVF